MSETITLPKSGIVLEREGNARDTDIFSHGGGFVRFNVRSRRADFNYRSRITGSTRDEAIAWLDARVLELRAALHPADARERVANELTNILSETFPDKLIYGYADRILAALEAR